MPVTDQYWPGKCPCSGVFFCDSHCLVFSFFPQGVQSLYEPIPGQYQISTGLGSVLVVVSSSVIPIFFVFSTGRPESVQADTRPVPDRYWPGKCPCSSVFFCDSHFVFFFFFSQGILSLCQPVHGDVTALTTAVRRCVGVCVWGGELAWVVSGWEVCVEGAFVGGADSCCCVGVGRGGIDSCWSGVEHTAVGGWGGADSCC